jgi:hypothetical protein
MTYSSKKIVFSAKGFGDCLIALKGIESASSEVTLVTPVYNKPLIDALRCRERHVQYLNAVTNIPALVTMRVSNGYSIIKDIALIRREVLRTVGNVTAYVDCWRNAVMWGVSRSMFLPKHQNIYFRYRYALGISSDTVPRLDRSGDFHETILVCPSARTSAGIDRRLPIELIARIDAIAKKRRLQLRVLLLENDEATLGYSQILGKKGVSVITIKKNFGDLIGTIRKYSNIISACSLTSHIAEYYSKNLMVLTPVDSAVFLQFAPFSSYINGNRSVFSDLSKVDGWFVGINKN